MIAYLLLKGKEFSLPDGVSTAIIGLFFGLLCGLFYYQHYQKSYYWGISLGGGLVLTLLFHSVFLGRFTVDDTSAIWLTIASFAVPFVLTLALNYGLYSIKHSKRKRKLRRREDTHFFDLTETSKVLQSDKTGKGITQ